MASQLIAKQRQQWSLVSSRRAREDGLAEPAEQKGSVFSEYVRKAHQLSERETSKPGWFWEPSVIGEKIWKVRCA